MEAVVIHDTVSYTHPDFNPSNVLATGGMRPLAYAERGKVLSTEDSDDLDAPVKIDERELRRLEKFGAVTFNKDSLEARLALAGQRQEGPLPPPYITLSSPAEQVRAVQAASRYPGGVTLSSSRRDLAKLSVNDLKVMAVAFGYPEVAESNDSDKIIEVLTQGENGPSAEDLTAQRQARDERQVAAREVPLTAREPGLVGENVTGQGLNATTGDRTAEPGETDEAKAAREEASTRHAGRRSSRASRKS